jgi:hypothetical protein
MSKNHSFLPPSRPGLLHSTGLARPIFVIPEGNLKNLRFVDPEIPFGNDKVAETRVINMKMQQPCRYDSNQALT